MDWFSPLLPEGVGLLAAIILITTAGFSAALTAAFGLGGGLILLSVMTLVLPIGAVIPIHGMVQLGANTSRALLQWRYVIWPFLLWISLGAIVGVFLGAQFIIEIPENFLKVTVALFVIYSVWGPKLTFSAPGPKTFFATGAISGFLTLFFGATGPIIATLLSRTGRDRFAIVATHGACMVVQHSLKIITFGLLGFAFYPWVPLILVTLLAGFIGTWIGVRLLNGFSETTFQKTLKILLSAIALYLLLSAGSSFFKIN